MRILLVEDEPELASALRAALERRDIVVDHAADIQQAEELAALYPQDAIILDRQLPDGDGLSLIPILRRSGNASPILVLTVRDGIEDRVDGLNHGADDYLTKPFAVAELLARLRALLRRPGELRPEVARAGRLSVDLGSRDAWVDSRPLDLTRRELLVLEALIRRVDRMVARAALMEAVFAADEEVQPNALDIQVSRLRRKLADASAGLVINGVRGVGYMLREDS